MSIFKISLKSAFAYRGSVIFQIIGSVFTIFISISLWKYVYSYDSAKMDYMVLYVIVSNIIGMFYAGYMSGEISSKIRDGTFALELIRPVNFLYIGYMKMLGQILAGVLMRGIPVILAFLPVVLRRGALIHYQLLPVFILVVALGHFLFTFLYSLIGYLAFVCFETWPFDRLMSDTIRFLSGSFLPLALFPDWLQKISRFLPFRYLYSFPIQLLLGEITPTEIVFNVSCMCGWLLGLGILLVLLFRRAVKAFVVQGG